MKVCLIPPILYKPALKYFMKLNQFSHQYALKQLRAIRPRLLYCIVVFYRVFFFFYIYFSARDEVALRGGGFGNGSMRNFKPPTSVWPPLGFLIAPTPRASSEPLCTICDAGRAR